MKMWLDTAIMRGPYLALCTTEEQYRKVAKHLKVKDQGPWLSPGSTNATCHTFEHETNGLCCVVCLRADTPPAKALSLIVHEAVHVWQEYRKYIGEDTPGKEQEAYSIQSIYDTLVGAFAEQTKHKTTE